MKTIAAISTATGNSGIGIIRMSGENCFEILNKIFIPKNKNDESKGYKIKYGNIINPKTNEIIDEVLVSYFIAPKSYTTENMCEINSHGGNIVTRKILNLCLENGAILAEPGEFTKLAFLNGRIDLSQAEAVIDIINAKSDREAKEGIKQLEGYLTKEINRIKEKILDLINAKSEKEAKESVKQLKGILANRINNIKNDIMSLMVDIEANIDYPEYDVEEVTNKKAINNLNNIKSNLEDLLKSFENGKIIKEGIKVAIIGKPNAGKSSLLNAFLNEERAIVTEYEGTTRDSIEEMITIEGIPLKIIDTAGIRNAKDEVEKIGILKAKEIAEEADYILAIFDSCKEKDEQDEEILKILENKNGAILINKIDTGIYNFEKSLKIENNENIIKISAKEGIGLSNIYKKIIKDFNLGKIDIDNNLIITNIRHKEQILKSLNNINQAINTLESGMPIDIIEINIRDAWESLGEITGESVSENMINEIFAKFCLGK